MNYQNVKIFMESVKNNDIFKIKSSLEGLIVLFKGDKVKCDEAVEYAIKNSSFNWEEDDGIFFDERLDTIKEKYYFEKERLVQNFTKKRYLNVLELYKQYDREETKKEQEVAKKSNVEEKINITIDAPKQLKKSEIRSSNSTKESSSKTSHSTKNTKSNRGLDQEDKIVFQRTAMLGLAIIVVVWVLVKIIF